ncbi:MAG: DUF4136 domain-containing protein [Pseudomonadota bacterium]
MQRWVTVLITALCVLLAGCATTFQSQVTAFHEWPGDLQEKTFVFERPKDLEDNLEYRSYENLVRGELLRLGFVEASRGVAPRLKVSMSYSINGRDVRVVQPVVVDPWYGYPSYGPFYGSRWNRYGLYDPFWYGPPMVEQRETRYSLFTRQLKIAIARTLDSKRLYEVTVFSEGTNGSLAALMPYMVRSAFIDFPGKSGVPRRIELKMKD